MLLEEKVYQVVIIGAGPAGLCLSYHLQTHGINYIVIEKENCVGSSWHKMPDHLRLITFWKSNNLLIKDRPLFPANAQLSAKEFQRYLATFSEREKVNVSLNHCVFETKKDGELFVIKTDKGDLKSHFLVDCRGYYSFPFLPELKIEKGPSPKIIHFNAFTKGSDYGGYKNILVVGKRLSAGQIIQELAENKVDNILLSVRSEVTYTKPIWIFNIFLFFLNAIERLLLHIKSNVRFEMEVPMSYSSKKYVKRIKQVGEIEKISGHTVYFKELEEGSMREASIDLIILATGYAPPPFAFAPDGFESLKDKNFYALGRGGQQSFRSRFLRGIREDAKRLAEIISTKCSN